MKKILFEFFLLLLLCSSNLFAQRHIMLNTTGYGFDHLASNGIHPEQWEYILKWDTITYNGQDASPTAVRLHIQWDEYEPTLGTYFGNKLSQAVQAIVDKGMKVALHFPYQRKGWSNDNAFLSADHVAKLQNGTYVTDNNIMKCPSLYSNYARQRFYMFVDNALAAIASNYSNIVFVAMGNTTAEETGMPWLSGENYRWKPGMYEDSALRAWRTEYLPCRFPGQSTVTFGSTTYNISSAPYGEPSPYDQTWSGSDLQKEYHRFAAWGIRRLVKGFRDVVKNRSSSLKVLNFISDFGGKQSNVFHLHSSSIPILHQETDGTYTSDGDDPGTDRFKIMALDILKGTDPSKIAAVEFDPEDLGRPNPQSNNINANDALTWLPRAFKHGADIVMLAMHFHDPMIVDIKPAMALVRANYANGTYTPPARQAVSATVNINPGVFGEFRLYESAWNAQGGNNFSVSDNNPVSIRMIDDGYWLNALSCTTGTNPCDFNITASATNSNPLINDSVTLNSSCTGECSGATYSWSGNGISGSGTSVTFNAPSTSGTYMYTIIASKSGCSPNKTATVQLNVQSSGGSTTCTNTIDLCSGNTFEIRSGTVNVSGAGSYAIVLTSRSHEGPATGRIRFNGGSWQNYSLPQTGVNEYIETALGNFTLNNGNNTVDLSSNGGFICFRKVCATGGSGCTNPAAPSLSASPSSISSGSSSNLSASGCSGGTITWSNGLGTGATKTVSPGSTTTYTATCSIGGCTSSNGSVTVTVIPPGVSCNQLQGYFDVVNCDIIAGWIYDAGHANDVVYIDLYEGTTLIQGNIAANIFRQDLLDAGKGNGVHGYQISTPSSLKNGQNRTLTMKQSACNYTLIWAPKTINCSGGQSVLEPDELQIQNRPKDILISPNPSKGSFDAGFYLEKGKKGTITIVDMHGRIIYNKEITGQGVHKERINLLNKASGMMLFQLRRDGTVEIKKINIAR